MPSPDLFSIRPYSVVLSSSDHLIGAAIATNDGIPGNSSAIHETIALSFLSSAALHQRPFANCPRWVLSNRTRLHAAKLDRSRAEDSF